MEYKISVVIPVHNTAPYLRRCIDSVLNQTLHGIEIILVDNRSTDNSPAICDEYASRNTSIRVLHLPIADLSTARNAGLDIASAPYVGFIDSDDYIMPTMYENMLKAMSRCHVDLVYCNFCFEYEKGRVEYLNENTGAVYIRSAKDVQKDIILEKVSSSACTKLYIKDFFDSHRFPENVFFEDHATLYHWVGEFKKVAWVDKAYYHYNQREGSICHTMGAIKHYYQFIAEYDRLEYVKKHDVFEDEELPIVMDKIVGNCFYHFNEFILSPEHINYKTQLKNMRWRLRLWLSLPEKYLSKKHYRRLRKIVYMWAFYYWKRR